MKLNINWNELVSRCHSSRPLHSYSALSLLFGSGCASWQLLGWLNYDTPRIMRGRAGVRDGRRRSPSPALESFSLFLQSQGIRTLFNVCVSLFTPFLSLSSAVDCWDRRGKLAIMTRLIVAYFVISWSLFSECVISEQLRSLTLSLSPFLTLSALANWVIAHSLEGITNVCFLSLLHLQYANSCLGKSSSNWLLKSHCLSDIRIYINLYIESINLSPMLAYNCC